MKALQQTLATTAITLLLVFGVASQARSVNLKIVFVDSIWGAAIGTVAGTAFWALGDADDDDLGTYLITGAACGALGGIVYGFLKAPYYPYAFAVDDQDKGLLHFDVKTDTLDLRPVNMLPIMRFDQEEHSAQFRFDLFTSSF